MEKRQAIYVAAYPKSGSTYLTRLLGDVLDSPTGGCMPSEDSKEIATEGQDRTGTYIVRKGHFVLVDNDTGPVVPSPHRLAWKRLTNEKIVFLVRDPRDICISGAYHWRCTPAEFLERMIRGDVARCGRWDNFTDMWINDRNLFPSSIIFRYEDLQNDGLAQLQRLTLLFPDYLRDLASSLKRQSFATRSQGLSESEMRRNNMRKGIVGDWRNWFSYGEDKEFNDRIWHEFGWMMERLGYQK